MYNFKYFETKYKKYIDEMKVTEQDVRWHSEGNVAIHTEMVMNEMFKLKEFKYLTDREKKILIYGVFFHDISKYETTKTEIINGQTEITAANHSKLGAKKTREILIMEDFDFYEREEIVNLVKYHGFPVFSYSAKDKKIIEISLQCNTKLLYLLAKSDMKGRLVLDENEIQKHLFHIEYFKETCIELNCYGKAKEFETVGSKRNYLKNENEYTPYEQGSKFYVISGLMGVGKNYYVDQKFKNLNIISLDDLRLKYKARRSDKKIQGKIIQEAYELAKEYLRNKQDFVWNATNLTELNRKKLVDLGEMYNAEVKIIYIEKSIKNILKQNKNREFPVPEDIIKESLFKIEVPTSNEAHYVEYVIN